MWASERDTPDAASANAARVAATAAAASFVGLIALLSLPLADALQGPATLAFGLALPAGLAAGLIRLHHAGSSSGDASDGPFALAGATLAALTLVACAGALAGSACMTAAALARAGSPGSWPFYLHGALFALALFVLLPRRPVEEGVETSQGSTDGAYTPVQLVADNTSASRRRAKARAALEQRLRINPDAEFEVIDWSRKYACTPDELKQAVRAVGTVAADVEAYLGRAR